MHSCFLKLFEINIIPSHSKQPSSLPLELIDQFLAIFYSADATDLADSLDLMESADSAESTDSANLANLANSYFNLHLDRLVCF